MDEIDEQSGEKSQRRRIGRVLELFALFLFLAAICIPVGYCIHGYRIAHNAASVGICLEIDPKLRGYSYTIQPCTDPHGIPERADNIEFARLQRWLLEGDIAPDPMDFFLALGTKLFHVIN